MLIKLYDPNLIYTQFEHKNNIIIINGTVYCIFFNLWRINSNI